MLIALPRVSAPMQSADHALEGRDGNAKNKGHVVVPLIYMHSALGFKKTPTKQTKTSRTKSFFTEFYKNVQLTKFIFFYLVAFEGVPRLESWLEGSIKAHLHQLF